MSASSSTKKIKEMRIDHLSALPDAILCYILSFLEMKNASITCLLSKRWQFLWTQLPVLRFKNMEKTSKLVTRIHRTLAICSRHDLERFEVDFSNSYAECFASDVNVWIGFAVNNKVKQFTLLLYGNHMLPHMMYSNPCWTSLSLQGCIMAPRGAIQWQSLTTLCMYFMELNEHTVEKIFSGCPALSSLDLSVCHGFNRLEVNSPSVHTLALKHFAFGHLKITAPYIRTFKITTNLKSEMCFENFKSLVRAEIDIYICDEEAPELWKKNTQQLFGSIGECKMLKLGHEIIKLLSIAPTLQLPQSTRACLELHVDCCNVSIPGIALILESSPNLETLVIHGYGWYKNAIKLNQASQNGLDCDLFHLRTVCFKNIRPFLDACEPMLTLARILLKRAVVLEKMVVDFRGLDASSSTTILNIISQKLRSYPRFSRRAVILFCF